MKEYLKISNEDNMELMKRFPDNYFDLAIVDPPYGINVNMNMGVRKGEKRKHKQKEWDNNAPNKEYFDELFRVSKNQIIWGANNFTENLKPSSGWIYWDKKISGDVEFSSGELAFTSFNSSLKSVTIAIQQMYIKEERIHPTQKPVALYEYCLSNYAKENDKILDTHLGSGSIALAVDNLNKIEKMNLTLTACELDNDYYNDAIKRINEKTNWDSLF